MRESDLEGMVAHYLDRLDGPGSDDAFHSLLECSREALPALIEAYWSEKRVGVKAAIVRIVWMSRDPGTVGFLVSTLQDVDAAVWKEALDGLVTIGGEQVLDALRESMESESHSEKLPWICEAIEQVRSGIGP
jgi:hypothetical protein